MGKCISKDILLQHTQNFIRAVMAERLHQEGFVSKGGDDIYWYRVVNGDVVHTVSFITRHTALPIILNIAIGCHPLFIVPEFPKGPYIYAKPAMELMDDRFCVMKQGNRYAFAPNALVCCPSDDLCGLDILDRAILELDKVQTPLQCYEYHKGRRMPCIEHNSWLGMSTEFVDEVIYWDDKDLYPYCATYIEGSLLELEPSLLKGNLAKVCQKKYDNLKLAKLAILEEKREEYLTILNIRKSETIRLLKKHTGLEL